MGFNQLIKHINHNTVHRGGSENSDRLINDHGYTKVISETSTPAMENVETNTQEREVNNDEVSTIAETTEVHIPGDVVQVIITMRDDYLANLSSYRVWYRKPGQFRSIWTILTVFE